MLTIVVLPFSVCLLTTQTFTPTPHTKDTHPVLASSKVSTHYSIDAIQRSHLNIINSKYLNFILYITHG